VEEGGIVQALAKKAYSLLSLFGDQQQIVGVDVGVFLGEFARALLSESDRLILYGIGPYRAQQDTSRNWTQKMWDAVYRAVSIDMEQYKDRWTLFRLMPAEAAVLLPAGVDFVYLNGGGAFETMILEIPTYEKLVRRRGVIAGGGFYGRLRGVRKAVEHYCAVHHRELCKDVENNMWWWTVGG